MPNMAQAVAVARTVLARPVSAMILSRPFFGQQDLADSIDYCRIGMIQIFPFQINLRPQFSVRFFANVSGVSRPTYSFIW